MYWKYDSRGEVPALQTQSPEFKPQSHQKEKKKIRHDFSFFLFSLAYFSTFLCETNTKPLSFPSKKQK
jgi:hypothetical protein